MRKKHCRVMLMLRYVIPCFLMLQKWWELDRGLMRVRVRFEHIDLTTRGGDFSFSAVTPAGFLDGDGTRRCKEHAGAWNGWSPHTSTSRREYLEHDGAWSVRPNLVGCVRDMEHEGAWDGRPPATGNVCFFHRKTTQQPTDNSKNSETQNSHLRERDTFRILKHCLNCSAHLPLRWA
jgi:hypothetical protein